MTGPPFLPVARRQREGRVERLLLVLMGGRLALALVGLVVGAVLDALGGEVSATERPGFYVTVALCFVAALVYRPFVGRIKHPAAFAAVNVATDLALVSALVIFSGGRHSVFTFLYLLVALYGAVLFPGRGGVLCAASGSLAYGAIVWLGGGGWLDSPLGGEPVGVLLTGWLMYTAALLASAGLASFLGRELERAGRALDERTTDLVHLRTLHQRTVESLMSGLLTTDLEGRVTSFNAEAERITGLSRRDALGRELEEVLPGIGKVTSPRNDGELRARARIEYGSPDGSLIHLGVGAYVLRDADGKAAGSVVIFQDVTQVVEMERELRRSERLAALGQLSSSIAHEIRNPLAAISGSIQVLRTTVTPQPGETARLMDIVVREIDRLDRLISEFLQFARPGELRLGSVPILQLLDEVLEMFEASRPEQIRVEREVEEGVAAVADEKQLRQVIWNLVLNASQAMADGGVLRVEAGVAGGVSPQGDGQRGRMEEEGKPTWVDICVMDQGAGIPDDVAERVFDPFFTTKVGGTGLGLATVHRVIGEHGGVVRIERDDPDWSTVIRVRLPMAEAGR